MGKKVLVISDIHTGSKYSLCHPTVNLEGGGKYKANPLQKKLFKRYKDMCETVGKVDILLLGGDLQDGLNIKEYGYDLWTTNINEQIKEAQSLIKMIDSKNIEGVEGTPYHDKMLSKSADREIVEGVGGTHNQVSRLDINGVKMHFRHHISGTSSIWMYKPTKIAREMLLADETIKHTGDYDILGFGHVHNFTAVEYGTKYGFTCPSWKWHDTYSILKNTYGWYPQHGYILFEVDNDGEWSCTRDIFRISMKGIIREVVV